MANTHPLTPLSLEILDALVVIATPGWTDVEVTVDRRDDKPYAFSIVARASGASGGRVDLGLDLGEVRAALDEALLDVDRELASEGRVKALRVTRDGDDRATLRFFAANEAPIAEVVIDEALYPYRVYTEALYEAAFGARVIDEGQRELVTEAQGHDDWEYESRTAELLLKKGVLPWRVYRAQVIATWAKESETLLWAWANNDLPETAKAMARRVLEGTRNQPGLGALRRPHLPADEPFASALARLAAARAGAWAVYPAAYENGVIYLAVMKEGSTRGTLPA
ncbi:MAG: hypothetical protein U0269_28770 [Polyangiales bacterium]